MQSFSWVHEKFWDIVSTRVGHVTIPAEGLFNFMGILLISKCKCQLFSVPTQSVANDLFKIEYT